MKFRPLHDRIVIRRIEGEEKTKGGIIIPDTAREKPQEGEVVAVGPGARDESGKLVPLELKAGDRGAVWKMVRHRGQDRRGGCSTRALRSVAFAAGAQFDNPMGERLMEGLRKAGVPEA